MATPSPLNPNPKPSKRPGGFMPPRMSFINIIAAVILLFLLIAGIYSQFSNHAPAAEQSSLSAIAADIKAGKVTNLDVQDDQITATYADKSQKTAGKETGTSIVESLTSLGVTPAELASTTIKVEQQSGFWYWAGELSPFLFPLIGPSAGIWPKIGM